MAKHVTMDYAVYLDLRRQFIESAAEQLGKYDRAIFVLASGAIALSVAWMEKTGIAGNVYPCLITSWICFLASIGSNLASHLLSARAFAFEIHKLDAAYERSEFDWDENPWNCYINLLNALSGIGFFVGAVFLVLVAMNL